MLETTIDYKERGQYLREVRKSQGKTLIDLEDENISRGTISHIENAKEKVSEEKIRYYCALLKVDYQRLPEYIDSEKRERAQLEQQVYAKLTGIEDMIELVDAKKGLRKLNKVKPLPSSLEHVVEFLKGRSYAIQGEFAKARKHFMQAIQSSPDPDPKNMPALSYNELGKLCYYQNNYEQAIEHTQQGIDCFNTEGERGHIWFYLWVNKAIYFYRTDNIPGASEILKTLWEQKGEFGNVEVLISMYDLQAIVFQTAHMFDEAINHVTEAIELARINKKSQRSVELWTTLGSIHLDKGELTQAESCFQIALEFRTEIKNRNLFLPVCIKLGELYIEQGKFDSAQKLLKKATNHQGERIYMSGYTKALTILGDCFLNQQLFAEATKPYEQAYKLAQQHALVHQEHHIYRKLLICWNQIDPEKFQQKLVDFFYLDVKLNRAGGA